MSEIRHRVGIDASSVKVYDALSTREGLMGWLTCDMEGVFRPGGTLTFHFGGHVPMAVIEVKELSPPECVLWRCVKGPSEWIDTAISFFLYEDGGETVLLFTHAGWARPFEFMHHCSTKWATFLLGLKASLENGKGTPWPNDVAISDWG